MSIHIGQEVSLIGRALRGATSVWDQVWSLGLEGWSPTWHWVQPRKNMLWLASLFVRSYVSFERYYLIWLIWLAFLYDVERSSEAPVCCNGKTNRWCVDEAIGQSDVWVLQGESWCSPDRGYLQGEAMSLCAFLTWLLDVFLPWSDVCADPFYHVCWMYSSHDQM